MRITIKDVQEMKRIAKKIAMMTAYDHTSARIVEESGIPVILVGDSLGQVVLGYDSTIPVTLDEMLHHTKAVVRGTGRALIVADMPFLTYQVDEAQALLNAGRFLKEGGAQAVKLEGGSQIAPTVRRMTTIGIPVMGHIGLTPQSVYQFGGYRVQGKTRSEAEGLLEDAIALEEAGAFSVVLELIPSAVASVITQRLSIPTVGIGAGVHCDGQIQVLNDILGLSGSFTPRHAKRYANLEENMQNALQEYISDVALMQFPTDQQSYFQNKETSVELNNL